MLGWGGGESEKVRMTRDSVMTEWWNGGER